METLPVRFASLLLLVTAMPWPPKENAPRLRPSARVNFARTLEFAAGDRRAFPEVPAGSRHLSNGALRGRLELFEYARPAVFRVE